MPEHIPTAAQAPNEQTFWLEHLEESNHYNEWILSHIADHLGAHVLEVGCGNGNFTTSLARGDRRVTAVDMVEEYVELARKRVGDNPRVEILTADATQTSWPSAFDSIVMLDVLEHIEDDVDVLARLREHLADDGKLIIKVPALAWLYSPMDEAIGHYRRYSARSLRESLTRAGFEVDTTWYFNMAGILGWWLNGKVLKRKVPPGEQISGFNRVVPLLRRIEGVVPPPIGLSVFAVARKPTRMVNKGQ